MKFVNILLPPIFFVVMMVPVYSASAETAPSSVRSDNNDGGTLGGAVTAVTESLPSWFPKVVGMQFNGVYQNVPGFHNPYEGPNSFRATAGQDWRDATQTYGVYLGSQLTSTLQAYLDLELFRGNGVSNGVGLAGNVNGDVVRAGSSNLPKDPYVARMYLRYYVPLSPETEKVDRGMDQLPGVQPVSRWEIKAGRLTLTDDFDLNRYANNNRTQFLNYDFLYNTAWDYAADTRGYSYGFVTALYQPKWRLALGIYMEPNSGNGANYDFIKTQELGYNLELTLKPNDAGTVIRVLTYLNESRMGDYNAALALAHATSTTPNLLAVEKQGGTKFGVALNFEQPLTDDGETGLFARLGWSDGTHESWAYVESDRHASLGAQVSGVHWGRSEDRVGIAYGINGLSAQHKDYLAAGGIGILLGDGKLNYGPEQALEAYYRMQLGPYVQITPDFQFIQNPGYNKDRGPAEVYGVRAHLSF